MQTVNQSDDERARKYALLQLEILDKGVDPSQFELFCEQEKKEGILECDIDNWSFKEIQSLIILYQQQKVPWAQSKVSLIGSPTSNGDKKPFHFDFTQHNDDVATVDQMFQRQEPVDQFQSNLFVGQFGWNGEHVQSSIIEDPINLDLPNKQLDQLEEMEQVPNQTELFKQDDCKMAKGVEESNLSFLKLPCKKLEKGFLANQQDLDKQLKIEGYETIEGSFFSSSYVVYNVQVKSLSWNVKRRYKDFVWLRSIFMNMYPGIVVPALSEKSIQKMSQATKEKRKILLEYFLRELVKTPEFLNSKFLIDFLRLDDKAFRQVVKASQQYQRPNAFDNLLNTQGFVHMSLDMMNESTFQTYELLYSAQEQIYQKIRSTLKQLESEYNQVQKTLGELAEQFLSLSKVVEKQDFTNQFRGFSTVDLYRLLKGVVTSQEEHTIKVKQLIKEDFGGFFKFHTMNFDSIKELIKTTNTIKEEIQDSKEIKQENYTEDLVNSFKTKHKRAKELIDIPSKNKDILREQLSFYNARLQTEFVRFQSNKIKTYLSHFANFSQNQQNLQDQNNKKLSCIQEDILFFYQQNPLEKSKEMIKKLEQY